MPRDIPLGNGNLLIAFDQNYQVRDLYWPHVGHENHSLGHVFRFEEWTRDELSWLKDPRWERDLKYRSESMASDIRLTHQEFGLEIKAADVVDFHEDLLVRRFYITNLKDKSQEVRLFFHQDFHIAGSELGDTAYYEPQRKPVIHYKDANWFIVNGAVVVNEQDPQSIRTQAENETPGYDFGVHGWSCG